MQRSPQVSLEAPGVTVSAAVSSRRKTNASPDPGKESDGRGSDAGLLGGASSPNGANNNDDDQNNNQRGTNESEEFADLGSAKVRLFPPEQSVVAWSVDVVDPEVHVVGV